MTRFYPVEESSRVAEVRRAAVSMAREEGLDETGEGHAALITTEVCTNVLKHAGRGDVFLSRLSERNGAGVEIVAVDRGPGMADVSRCIADGYSSTQTAGTGLGAIARLSDDFDIYSEPGKGTVLVAQVRKSGLKPVEIGAVLKPITGEEVSGDAWACRENGPCLVVMVADGLGHGLMAARASAEAVSAFKRAKDLSPVPLLRDVHAALRGTRGAAVAVAMVNRSDGAVKYSGIGNIGGVIATSGKPQFMVSHNGTAGHEVPRLQEFSYTAPDGALVVMHSDGLATSWNLDAYPGLRVRHPSVIAGVLYRDSSRQRDDVCVVIAKARGGV